MTQNIDRTGSDLPRSKVAVVVVHGVSDQQPFDSARSIANLLFHRYNHLSRYDTFVEQQIRIPVQALTLPKHKSSPEKSQTKPNWRESLDERGDRIRDALHTAQKTKPDSEDGEANQEHNQVENQEPFREHDEEKINQQIDEYSHAFTCDFLEHYNPQKAPDLSANVYDTIRLETCRSKANDSEQDDSEQDDSRQAVHLYELYWADLSRLGTGFVQFFSAFYQLLFHLASLGRHTIDLATLEYSSYARGWGLYSKLHAWTGRILAIPIPLLSLYLLIAAFLSLPSNIPDRYQSWIAVSAASLFAVAGVSYGLWRNFKQSLWVRMGLPPLVALSVVGLHGILERFGYYKLLTIEWLIVSTALIWFLLITPYAKRRQGLKPVAAISGVFLLGGALYLICRADRQSIPEVVNASFMTIEVIYFLLVVSWFVFYLLYVFVLLDGFWLQSRLSNPLAKERARRANWTARVSLWAPTVLFSSVTSALWAGLIFAGSSLLPEGYLYTPTASFRGFFLSDSNQIEFSGSDFFNRLLIDPFFIIILGSLLLTLVIVAWSLLPSLWAEVQTPPDPTPQFDDSAFSEQSDSTHQRFDPRFDDRLTLRFGVWLSQGGRVIYWALNILTVLLAIAIVAILGSSVLSNGFKLFNLDMALPEAIDQPIRVVTQAIQGLRELSKQIIAVLAVLLTASATSILVLGRRLDQISLGFRSVLDITLDVDNYLRLHPKEDNPRARIFARYSSLLRYLYQWSDPEDGRGYDALIIVAHSQGTVITADLLRFLQREPYAQEQLLPAAKPDFAGIPISFFSMGTPLNQLYAAGFPHLYNWVLNFDFDANGLGQNPKPEKLGLDRWVNTFRSGDYIGRYLWRSNQHPSHDPEQQLRNLFKPDYDCLEGTGDTCLAQSRWREFCLGAGAHTHYWDANADRVADEIDRLIDETTH